MSLCGFNPREIQESKISLLVKNGHGFLSLSLLERLILCFVVDTSTLSTTFQFRRSKVSQITESY